MQPDFAYSTARTILLVADDAGRAERGARVLAALGASAQPPVPIAEGVLKIAELPGIEAVLVEVDADRGDLLDDLLRCLDRAAREERFASVVALPPALVDVGLACAPSRDVILLSDPSEADRMAAVSLALARGPAVPLRMRERDPHPHQLLRLSEDIERIARTLAALSGEEERAAPSFAAEPDEADALLPTAASIRAAIRRRRLRDRYFPPSLFADPAWDMLLDLMAARLEGRQVAVSSLCIAAAVPATTALRWMKSLTQEGLFRRVQDPRDGRRVFIELSDEAAGKLIRFFQAAARIGNEQA